MSWAAPTSDVREPTSDVREPTSDVRSPSAESRPSVAASPGALDHLRAWFFGGNTVVRAGVIILLFGVGFLVKYAADHAMFPIEARLACTALLGIALIGLGFRLRNNRLSYAVSLQGGGIGIIYLVAFAAFKIYHLIPAPAALAIFIALGVFTGVLAVLQDAMALAILGIAGGFLAPILASEHQGDHVALFTYYTILNAGILGLAWFKSWRVLNLVGFTFTFVIGTLWGVSAYKPENYLSTQLFLALFFVFYAAIAVTYALRRPSARALGEGEGAAQRGFVDGTLTFGLPAIAFGLQVGLVKDTPWGLAISSVMLAAFYIGIATIVWQRSPSIGRQLAEAFTAIGVVFVTMALPFALNAQSLNARLVQGLLIVWGLAWLAGGVVADCIAHAAERHVIAIMVSAAAAHHVVLELASHRLAWKPGRFGALLLGPVLVVLCLIEQEMLASGGNETYAWAAWLIATVAWLFIIKRDEDVTPSAPITASYAMTPALVAFILSAMAYRCVALAVPEGVWAATLAFVPALVLGILANLDKTKRWPLTRHARAILYGAAPVVVFLVGWSFAMSFSSSGDPAPLLYIPLLTPLDITQAFVVMSCAWVMHLEFRRIDGFAELEQSQTSSRLRAPLASVLVAVVFVHLSAVCVRSVHVYTGVPWDIDDLLESQAVQATLSIAWTVIALVVTTLASHKHWRAVWMIGGALLGVVIIKLFVVDLSSIGTGTRIISFIVVGLLLLLIGWLSPVPPKRLAQAHKDRYNGMTTFILALLCTQVPGKHVVVHREDFAFGARLQTEPGHAIQSLTLPASIYDALTRPDAGDIAVFNASGAQVPHALKRVNETLSDRPDVTLPVFPLRGSPGSSAADVQINIEHSENGAVATVKTSSPEQSALIAYVVDLTSITHPLRSLTFKFHDSDESLVTHFTIDASDDLASWRTVVYDATVASLVHDGHRIAQETVETAPFAAKYLRISWSGRPPSQTLDQVVAGLAQSVSEPEREWLTITDVQVPRPGVYRFHLSGYRPVDRIRVHLPEDNTLASVTLASATSVDGPWTTRYSGLAYRLDSKGIGDQSIAVPDVADPDWQLEVATTGGGIGNGTPTFDIGWQPHELQFVARGTPPFVLAYGNANTAVAAFDPAALATMARSEGGEAIGHAIVVDPKVELGGIAKLTPEPPDASLTVRSIVLWMSLAAAVLLLGWMSVRLFRQLGT